MKTKKAQKQTLSGIKIIDLSRVLGGPYATQTLSDHGAEVIKIEPPRGDETREWGPPFQHDYASYFAGTNRNKRSISIDLSTPEGRDILLKLLESADVIIENFKIGTLEKWNLGYKEILKKKYPRLIHCRLTGFGEQGPYAKLAGYDAVAQAMSGLMSINGAVETPPVRIGIPLIDMAAGLNLAFAISMALYERQFSELGQSIEISLYDTGLSLLHPQGANFLMSGHEQYRSGNAHPNICPYSQFKTKTGNIFIGCGNDGQFKKLCQIIGKESLSQDPRFCTNGERLKHKDILTVIMEDLLQSQNGEVIAQKLLKAGIPAAPVFSTSQALTHPQARARDMLVEKDGYRGIGIPIKLSRTPGEVKSAPPKFSEHMVEILTELGYSDSDINALKDQKIVYSERKTT